jgi:fused signal recognition particle receptor
LPFLEEDSLQDAQIQPLQSPDTIPVVEELPTERPETEPLVEELPGETPEAVSAFEELLPETPEAEPILEELPIDRTEAEPLLEEPLPETSSSVPTLEESYPETLENEPILEDTLPESIESEPVPDAFLADSQLSAPEIQSEAEKDDLEPLLDEIPEIPEEPEKAKKGWFSRLKDKLSSTREKIAGRIEKVLASTRSIDESILEDLEEILYTSDLGVPTTQNLLVSIKTKVQRKELKDVEALKLALRDSLIEMLDVPQKDLVPENPPRVILVVGVNGVGKTTTIAKLARTFTERGQKVLLAAGDTFRAAAVEQLKIWAQRLNTDFVAQATGADAAAVIFDALSAAKARGSDVVIIDTAGRLHTKVNLMEELKKIKKVAGKAVPGAPHETILILDANTGQNASRQAQTFNEAIGVDSIIVTKLDGTSKGGVVVSICYELKLPVIFIGIGESYEDLKPFDKMDFANAILGIDSDNNDN